MSFTLGPGIEPSVFETEPDLALAVEQPEDGKYVFQLKENVPFHDVQPVNGRIMTSDDVRFSLERLLSDDPGFTHSYMLEPVTAIDTPDENTVVLTMSRPFAPLFNYLASLYASVVPHEIVDEHGSDGFKDRMVGTGPYILDTWERNSRIAFLPNPAYFNPEAGPYLDSLEFQVVPAVSSQVSSFKAGAIDVFDSADDLIAQDIKRSLPDASQRQYSTQGGGRAWRFRTGVTPFDDVRVRQALVGVLDRTGEAQVWGADALPMGPLSLTYQQAANPEDLGFPWVHDVGESKALMDAAGFGEGFSTQIAVTTAGHGQVSGDSAAYYAQRLQQLNVTAEIVDLPYGDFLDQLYDAQYDIQSVGWPAAHDIDEFFATAANYIAGGKGGDRFDTELDRMIEAQRFAASSEERDAVISELQQYLGEQCYLNMNALPVTTSFWAPRLRNYSPNGLIAAGWGSQVLREIWIDA